MSITNKHNIPMLMAAWLLHDEYDHKPDEKVISATSLLKPIRQLVLSKHISQSQDYDISALVPSRMGTAVHSSVEQAWKSKAYLALSDAGYNKKMLDKIVINPTEITDSVIPVYLELRKEKEINGFTISGKFDAVIAGILHDIKTTSVHSYMDTSRNDSYIKQMSIYRWLNPEIVTEDYAVICSLFTDWAAYMAKRQSKYPPTRLASHEIKLMSIPETTRYISYRLNEIVKNSELPEKEVVRCTNEELWMEPSTYKYYADPSNLSRSSKNFTSAMAAQVHLASKGKGVVHTVHSKPKRCEYCPVYNLCSQKDEYFND